MQASSYDRAATLLKDGRLHQACAFLSVQFEAHAELRPWLSEVYSIRADYDRMLDFFAQGSSDPRRSELMDQLMDRAWTLAEHLYEQQYPPTETEGAISLTLVQCLDRLHEEPSSDQKLGLAFEYIYQCHSLTSDERRALHQAVLDERLPEYVRATLLGAETLHLTQWFDAKMVEDLYIYTLDDQPSDIRVRAWVTLVFVALIHPHRIAHLPRLREQYQLICEEEPKMLSDIQLALLQCREAYTFDQKLHEIAELDESKSINLNVVKDFFDFISEGIDMSISMFSKLRRIKFFSGEGMRHHWLEPFSPEQPDVKAVLDQHPAGNSWTQMLMQSVAQCETDKYGAFISMNEADSNLMVAISEKLDKTGILADKLVPPPPLYVMRNYLHDLFRYCELHPECKRLRHQPFNADLMMIHNPWLKAAVCSIEQMRKVAEFLLRKERWAEADEAYCLLLEQEVTEQSLQRLAYVRLIRRTDGMSVSQMLEPLLRANALFPGNKWTLKQIAETYRHAGMLQLEEQALREASALFPDDTLLSVRLGHCLIAQHRPEEALEPLYKADVQEEGQSRVHRELANALFSLGDHARAERYIRQVLNNGADPEDEDMFLGGHIALLGGDIPLALERYEMLSATAPTELDHARPMLTRLGIDNQVISLVADELQRRLNRGE